MLSINVLAPDFSLVDQSGTTHSLSQYRGQWVLLYFYPKDNTPGCTAEACSIRDAWSDFARHNIKVLGVSADTIESHQKFTEQYHLPFTLLADTDKQVISLYQAKGLFTKRISYLINPDGEIVKAYPKVSPSEHAAEVLADVAGLSK